MVLLPEHEIPKYSPKSAKKCINCGKPIGMADGMYSRIFCSMACKEEYFSPIKTV